MGDGVGRLQRGDDPLGAAEELEAFEGFVVGDASVGGAARVFQPGVLRANAGVVEAGRYRMGFDDLSGFVLEDV